MAGVYDVSEAFNDLIETVEYIPGTAGAYIDGEWVDGVTQPSSIHAVVLPMSYSEILKNNPEAPSDQRAVKIWSKSPLQCGDREAEKPGDKIMFNGFTYKITEVLDFDRAGGYYRAIAYMEI